MLSKFGMEIIVFNIKSFRSTSFFDTTKYADFAQKVHCKFFEWDQFSQIFIEIDHACLCVSNFVPLQSFSLIGFLTIYFIQSIYFYLPYKLFATRFHYLSKLSYTTGMGLANYRQKLKQHFQV